MRIVLVSLLLCATAWGAVAKDATMTTGNGTATTCTGSTGAFACATGGPTSITSTGMTVGASATLLVATLVMGNAAAPTGVACNWDTTGVSQSMTNAKNVGPGTPTPYVAIFTLVNPHTGNKTLACSWTGANDVYLSAISFTGTDTTTGINAADSTSATAATSLTVTSDANGATVVAFGDSGAGPTMGGTGVVSIFSNGHLGPDAGASYKLGGTSNVHTFGETGASVGIHVIAGSGGPTVHTMPPAVY